MFDDEPQILPAKVIEIPPEPLKPKDSGWHTAQCATCLCDVAWVQNGETKDVRCLKAACSPELHAEDSPWCRGSFQPSPAGCNVQPQACRVCREKQMIMANGQFRQHYKPGRHPSTVATQDRKIG